jgi:hypothetical protein
LANRQGGEFGKGLLLRWAQDTRQHSKPTTPRALSYLDNRPDPALLKARSAAITDQSSADACLIQTTDAGDFTFDPAAQCRRIGKVVLHLNLRRHTTALSDAGG